MNCKYFRNLMGAYIYGDLSPEEMRAVRMHTQDCASCKADLNSRGSVINRISNTTPGLSDDDRQRILWRTNDAINNSSPRKKSRFTRLSPVFAILGMLIVGYVIGMLLNSQPHRMQETATKPAITDYKNTSIPAIKREKVLTPSVTATNKATEIKEVPTRENTADRFNGIVETVRRSVTIGTITSRNEEACKKQQTIIIDEPLPVAPSPNKINTEVKKDDAKMPEPKGLTDAQTTEIPKN